jgi:hypothetical protein
LSFGSGWWWPYGPYHYPPYPYRVDPYYGPYGPDWGALDLDVAPEKAQVYLDGDYIGVADNYDGFPRHLWLEKGEHRLVFYHEGYETLVRDLRVRPNEVITLDDRLVRGAATPPSDYFQTESDSDTPEWAPSVTDPRATEESEPEVYRDQRSTPARLELEVRPADAAVYLDGRFLGTGEDLGRLHAGLLVDPGEHEIEVTRPGYRTQATKVVAASGKQVRVAIELERD